MLTYACVKRSIQSDVRFLVLWKVLPLVLVGTCSVSILVGLTTSLFWWASSFLLGQEPLYLSGNLPYPSFSHCALMTEIGVFFGTLLIAVLPSFKYWWLFYSISHVILVIYSCVTDHHTCSSLRQQTLSHIFSGSGLPGSS